MLSVGWKAQAETTHSKQCLFRSHLYFTRVSLTVQRRAAALLRHQGFAYYSHKFPTQLEAGGPEGRSVTLVSESAATVQSRQPLGLVAHFSPPHSIVVTLSSLVPHQR